MIEVVSVKFRSRGKIYFFDPAGVEVHDGDRVVVETSKGLELGDAVQGNHPISEDRVVQPLRPVARVATQDDLRIAEFCRKREREAFDICKKKIEEHGLEMKLVEVECSFEGNKILFFFSSEGRVDFRELVKDLAGVFRTRIELRQIGVRDEARMLGGLGICGRPFCCEQFLDDFQPVSTKMAKIQSMSLNPAKISGACGRLMCCLRYEQQAYEELVKSVPKSGAFVETADGYGNVVQTNILRQNVKVKLDGVGGDTLRTYAADEVATVPGGRPREGGVPAHVLVIKPKPIRGETEKTDDSWQMPQMLPVMPGDEKETVRPKKRGGKSRRPQKDGAQAPKDQEARQYRQDKQHKTRPDKTAQPQKAKPDGQSVGQEPKAQSPNARRRNRSKMRPESASGQNQPPKQKNTGEDG